MVYLIGCDHSTAQTYPEGDDLDDPNNTLRREFKELLIQATERHHPTLIAEEFSQDILNANLPLIKMSAGSAFGRTLVAFALSARPMALRVH
ncbi:MAG TPA: hypothetical protein VHX49_08535 [Candidatus Acidoferrales bacterium]|nr:hypothetical protein [Candidatus Acidoferrales bacterium]